MEFVHKSFFLVLLVICHSSCAYRFTNNHVRKPAGIESVAVEAVYDTTRAVLPHELLWQELQRAIAADGKLHLTTQSKADALVRAHLMTGDTRTGRIASKTENDRDPELETPEEFVRTGNIADFKRLTQAGEHTLDNKLVLGIRIEVIDLRSKRVLLNKTYRGIEEIKTARKGDDPGSFFLIYTEATENQFRKISRRIATRMVQDLLITF